VAIRTGLEDGRKAVNIGDRRDFLAQLALQRGR